jgi:hypothetical protein
VTGVCGFLLRTLPDLGLGNIIFISGFFFLCFKLIDFLLKERRVIEFDEDNLYIVDKQRQQEAYIPLKKLTRLNMRPAWFSIGNYWFNKYSLKFIDDFSQEQKISFYIQAGKPNTQKFVSFVKSRNPYFNYKNWTHTFDLSD